MNRERYGFDINVMRVWERNITGRGVTAAVVDDGGFQTWGELHCNNNVKCQFQLQFQNCYFFSIGIGENVIGIFNYFIHYRKSIKYNMLCILYLFAIMYHSMHKLNKAALKRIGILEVEFEWVFVIAFDIM